MSTSASEQDVVDPNDPIPVDTSAHDPDPIDPTVPQDPQWVPPDFSGVA